MFENLGTKFSSIIKNFSTKGRIIKQADLDQTLQDIRIALLESDVSLRVVTTINNIIKEKALGAKIFDSISPSEMIVKISHDAIREILGDKNPDISEKSVDEDETERKSSFPLEIKERILLVGLQGSGKTTTAAKLGNFIKNVTKKSPLISSVDYYRPAAREQLKILCERNNLKYFNDNNNCDYSEKVISTIRAKLNFLSQQNDLEVSIFDTAGRISVDEKMMEELVDIKNLVNPTKIILVLDAISGKTAIEVAKHFNDKLSLSGIIFTKVDSDTKSGVILSVRKLLNLPIFFLCSGEKIEDIDEFIPDRIAQRILGMGDIVSLVEKASAVIPSSNSDSLKEKAKEGKLDLFDVLEQFKFLKKLGGLPFISKFLPAEMVNNSNISEEKIRKFEAVILSMTPKERSNPKIVAISRSRKDRIAKGSGCFEKTKSKVPDVKFVEELLQMHEKISKMAQQFAFFEKGTIKDQMKMTESVKNLVK